MAFSKFMKDRVILVKNDGAEFPIKAQVSRNKRGAGYSILTVDTKLQPEQGDTIRRPLPNGTVEEFVVVEATFQAGSGGAIPAMFQIEVVRSPPKITPVSSGEPAALPTTMGDQVFVSHSSRDAPKITGFVREILESGLGIHPTKIFCISNADQGIPPGEYFIPYIRTKVQDAASVIALITPEFFASPFCMCELGAAWAMKEKSFLPILWGVTYAQLVAVLQGMQVLNLSADVAKTSLNQLRDELNKRLLLPQLSTMRWESARDRFTAEYI